MEVTGNGLDPKWEDGFKVGKKVGILTIVEWIENEGYSELERPQNMIINVGMWQAFKESKGIKEDKH